MQNLNGILIHNEDMILGGELYKTNTFTGLVYITSLKDREATTSKDLKAGWISEAGTHLITQKRWCRNNLMWKASLIGHSNHRAWWISGF